MKSQADNVRRIAAFFLAVSTAAIAVGYASAFITPPAEWGPWMLAIGIPAAVTAVMVLGATRGSRGVGSLAIPFVFVFAILAGGFCLALALPAEVMGDRLWLGLPLRAAIVIYGVGLAPIVVLPIAYALTFRTQTLNESDIERVREIARSMREERK